MVFYFQMPLPMFGQAFYRKKLVVFNLKILG